MKRYTAAIVGCGSIGNAHMEGYNLVDEVEVIAVSDPVPMARKTYVDAYGIPQEFETVEEMMEKAKPDIVSVCTWHLLHPAPTIAAAAGGARAVICEKPMAIGMAAADSMVDACEAHGTQLVISHQRRFTPGWEKAKALVEEGAIGEPIFVTNKVADGLTNWGTHSIDGSRFVLGDPRAQWVMGAVERHTDRYERDTMIEDACMGLVHFNGGLQLFIQSDLMREGAGAGCFEIRGSEGILSVSETRLQIMNASSGGWRDVDLALTEGSKAIGGNTNAAQVRELHRLSRRPQGRAPQRRHHGPRHRGNYDGPLRIGAPQPRDPLAAARKGLSPPAHGRRGRPTRRSRGPLRHPRLSQARGHRRSQVQKAIGRGHGASPNHAPAPRRNESALNGIGAGGYIDIPRPLQYFLSF